MVNKAAKLAGGVGEIIPVGGLILKGISTMTSVILETIEVSGEHMSPPASAGQLKVITVSLSE
jgi:hypothetical protein